MSISRVKANFSPGWYQPDDVEKQLFASVSQKDFLKNFAKFIRKHLCRSLFSKKLH